MEPCSDFSLFLFFSSSLVLLLNACLVSLCKLYGYQEGRTPLHFACVRGYTEIAAMLLQYGANVAEKGGDVRPMTVAYGMSEFVSTMFSHHDFL